MFNQRLAMAMAYPAALASMLTVASASSNTLTKAKKAMGSRPLVGSMFSLKDKERAKVEQEAPVQQSGSSCNAGPVCKIDLDPVGKKLFLEDMLVGTITPGGTLALEKEATSMFKKVWLEMPAREHDGSTGNHVFNMHLTSGGVASLTISDLYDMKSFDTLSADGAGANVPTLGKASMYQDGVPVVWASPSGKMTVHVYSNGELASVHRIHGVTEESFSYPNGLEAKVLLNRDGRVKRVKYNAKNDAADVSPTSWLQASAFGDADPREKYPLTARVYGISRRQLSASDKTASKDHFVIIPYPTKGPKKKLSKARHRDRRPHHIMEIFSSLGLHNRALAGGIVRLERLEALVRALEAESELAN